ncbi:hypothetical protein [Desulfosarcina variabilis]|uniref:hypothetical protein n=1 Tax=Desulfosarcina variabilis TaxID=2300 RepID=UPI003AFA4E09
MKANDLPEAKAAIDGLKEAVANFEQVFKKVCLALVCLDNRIQKLEQHFDRNQ